MPQLGFAGPGPGKGLKLDLLQDTSGQDCLQSGEGLGFKVQGLGLGCRVSGLGFRV